MTVNSTSSVKTYTGNAVTTAFNTLFQFIDYDDIKVYIQGTLKTITTDYTVSGGNGSTGTVTFVTAPANNAAIVLQRLVDYVQETDYADFDGNPAITTETQFDLVVMQIQQLRESSNRALFLPVGTSGVNTELTLTGNEGSYIRYNSAGDAFELVAALDSEVAVSAFMQTVLDDLTPAAARATLGINLPNSTAGDAGKTLVANAGGTGYDLTSATLAAQITAAIAANNGVLYPIGSTYINKTDATNPATLFGFGTWVAETDKFIVSHGSTFTTNGGATTVMLAANQIPALTGQLNATNGNGTLGCVQATGGGSGSSRLSQDGNVSDPKIVVSIPNASQQGASIIPPYQAYYIWTRTA